MQKKFKFLGELVFIFSIVIILVGCDSKNKENDGGDEPIKRVESFETLMNDFCNVYTNNGNFNEMLLLYPAEKRGSADNQETVQKWNEYVKQFSGKTCELGNVIEATQEELVSYKENFLQYYNIDRELLECKKFDVLIDGQGNDALACKTKDDGKWYIFEY